MPNYEASYPPRPQIQRKHRAYWRPGAIGVIRLLWFLFVYYQESWVFRSALRGCKPDRWHSTDTGQRGNTTIALVGDPQLIDENTYDRRGIALKVTQFYTDRYMRRNYKMLHSILDPSLTVFTGDLFDGGREWNDSDWYDEANRFHKVFPDVGKRVEFGLPGNHDIGISEGLQEHVYARFTSHFGPTSRLIELENWDIIILDAISLSSKNERLSQPHADFIKSLAPAKRPRLLVVHVPPYRPADSPCGPLRESHESIRIQRGYQYQNVLDPDISQLIWDVVNPAVIFAGDDHDYCDYTHDNGVHVYNAKSFSWAMGVKNPGVQLVTLIGQEYHTELCLLPDQLWLFKCYGYALVLTILCIVVLARLELQKHDRRSQRQREDLERAYKSKSFRRWRQYTKGMRDLGQIAWPVMLFYLFSISF